jgi:hypothetical protein
VHVDVVDGVEGQLGHAHVAAGVDPHPGGHERVHLRGCLVRLVVAAARAVLIDHQVAAEGRAKAVRHEVAAGMHQVVRRGGALSTGFLAVPSNRE